MPAASTSYGAGPGSSVDPSTNIGPTVPSRSDSAHTTSWSRLPTSGFAMPVGTGVTRPTHWLARCGVRTGTVTIVLGIRPAIVAKRLIISR